MAILSKFREQAKQFMIVREASAGVRLARTYLRALPDYARWRRLRHAHRKRQPHQAKSARPDSPEFSRSLHIVFVSNQARARECKLAHAARLSGHRVTLVAEHLQSAETVQNFDAYRPATNPWQVLSILDELSPDVVHLFAYYNRAETLPVILHAQAPLVYDPYDCLQGMFESAFEPPRFELSAERISFARAQHICSRSLEPLYLRRHFKYRMPATTFFPEYCWQQPARHSRKSIGNDDELHVVYCGGVWPEDRFPADEFGYAQYIEVSRVLAADQIHLHIYPTASPLNTDFEEFFSLYLAETRDNSFLHFYRPLPYAELMQVLPKYDAAMHIMGPTISRNLGRVTRAKLDYSTANKLFDYVEAGLPVIIHDGKHQRGLVRHYGHSVEVARLGDLRKALQQVVWKARPATANITYHAERLNRMYQAVAK